MIRPPAATDQPQRQLLQLDHGAPGGRLAAEPATLPSPRASSTSARTSTTTRPTGRRTPIRRGAVQYRDPRARSAARIEYYLPALKIQWDLGKSQIISNTSYYHRKQLTAYQGTVYDLSYWQTIPSALGGPDESAAAAEVHAPDDATSCSWFPLLDANGIHLPAALRGTQTPNIMTNKQESYTQELRWQSTDPTSKWNWTAGLFWQLAKEGSVEELRSTNIDQVSSTTCSDSRPHGLLRRTRCTHARPMRRYPSIPACDIYYNSNTTFDRQIAAFGEVSYAFTDWFRVTVGERIARTSSRSTTTRTGTRIYGARSCTGGARRRPPIRPR